LHLETAFLCLWSSAPYEAVNIDGEALASR
jgi:hypothetical protein